MSSIVNKQQLAGGLWGLLVGDAVGVPYEFHSPTDLPAFAQLDMTPPPTFARAHARIPIGTWSDDGAQALILLASLLKHNGLDLTDFAKNLVRWYKYGYMAVNQQVFDVGIQTAAAIRRIMQGHPAEYTGSSDEQANGNGSLMRVLPLALWHQGSDADLIELAHLQSVVTHAHKRSQVCCALYCLWARGLLHQQELETAWQYAVGTLRSYYGQASEYYAELEFHIRPDDEPIGQGSGYVVDSLRSARMVLQREHSYKTVIKAAIALGHDTDTTACIAGGLAGIYYGVEAIPQRWMEVMRGKEEVELILNKLLHMYK
jgi:ADP-ribosylglycohydrolase